MISLWSATASMLCFPTLKKDIKTDVLVIGGGMAGLLTAYELSKKGVSCVVVEKGRICGMTTQNTTAKITVGHGLIYSKIKKAAGEQAVRGYYEANSLALKEYKKLCRNIDCDFEIKDNYVYSLNDRQKLEDELSALLNAGVKAEFCEKLSIPVKTKGAVKLSDQAQFHPLKFAASIAKNLEIYENTFVKEISQNTAVTDHAKIRAEKIVVATHFPFINNHGGFFVKLYQDRSYVVALENAQQVNGMYIDESGKGLSFRNSGKLLLLGGGAHRTGKREGGPQVLTRAARDLYPKSRERYLWAAQDCMSLDGIPYIGRYSKGTPDICVASGFNKWGMTGSMLSALLLSDMILGKDNDYYKLFDPSRSILKPQFFINGFESVKGLLTISKKRCPHLGCALKYNKAEHSWDCSCHGSRFSQSGKVLDNPANGNLENMPKP